MLYLIANWIYIFILSLCWSIIIYNINLMEITKKSTIIIAVFLFSVSMFLDLYKQDTLIFPIITILITLCLYVLFKKMFYAILLSILTQFIFSLADISSGVILLYIFKLKYYDILHDSKIKIITALLILIICYFISRISNKLFKDMYIVNFFKVKLKNFQLLFSSLLIVIVCIYSYSLSLKIIFNNHNELLIFLNIFFVFGFFLLIFILTYLNYKNIKKDLDQEYTNKELLQLKQHTEVLEELSKDLRSFRHDYINILQTMGEYIKSDNIADLKKFYYNELMPESKKILEKNRSYTLLQYIKIDPLKGILSSKIINAQSKNIDVKIEISEPINELSINVIDICRIVGILFDNAIEASLLCDNKFIELIVYNSNNITTFIINNSCLENTPPIHLIYQKDFSTKGTNRGIGLKFIKDILNKKYNNVHLNTSMEKLIFTQELVIANS